MTYYLSNINFRSRNSIHFFIKFTIKNSASYSLGFVVVKVMII